MTCKFVYLILMICSLNAWAGLEYEKTIHKESEAKVKKKCLNCCGDVCPSLKNPIVKLSKKTYVPVKKVIKTDPQPIVVQNNNINNNIVYPQNKQFSAEQAPVKRQEVIKVRHRISKVVRIKNTHDHHQFISLYGSAGFLTRYRNLTLEAELRSQYWGFGIYGQSSSSLDPQQGFVIMTGAELGLALHYHFLPHWYTYQKRSFDPGFYGQFGYGRFNMESGNHSFSGLTESTGLDLVYSLAPKFNAYLKGGISYIREGSQWLYTGETLAIGVRIDLE